MYELLHKNFEKMILEGNETLEFQLLDHEYKVLAMQMGLEKQEEPEEKVLKFISDFTRHFSVEVAARVKLVVLQLLADKQLDNSQRIEALNHYDLWKSKNEINQLILQTYLKWKAVEH